MKKNYLSRLTTNQLLIHFFTLTLVMSMTAFAAQAQITCDNPDILIQDDIEGLAIGDANGQVAWWGAWPGGAVSGEVTTEQAESGSQSIKVSGNSGIGGQDVLLKFNDETAGHFVIRWDMYIPSGSKGYFNLQHQAPTASAGFWAFDVFFDPDGAGVLTKYDGSDDSGFEYPYDEWFPVLIFVDLDNDVARMTVAEHYVDQWQFSTGVTNGGADFPLKQLNSINFYPIDATYQIYLDNVNFWQIPAAEEGKYCYTAATVDVGQHTISGADCFGAGYHYGGTGSASGGLAGVWYAYTPAESGTISVGSCNGDSDSRVWLFKGDCDNIEVVGMNDDRCEQSNGDPYASYKEAYVEAGVTYYIMWDDRWDNAGFKWNLTFSADAPAEAAFCQSAQVVTPGDIMVDAFVGEAAVAGDDIFDFCSSSGRCPAGYTGSNWYAYTAEGDGTVTISSCEAGTNTYVFVYTGTCGDYSSLELVASSEDDCDVSSLIEGMEVTAGTTYYIEWIDDRSSDAFTWTLDYMRPITCDEPAILIEDDIEGLAVGDANGQVAWWGAWPGGAVSGEVTTEQAESGSQSIKVSGNSGIGSQDVLLKFNDQTSGHYIIRWDMFIPSGSQGYFNMQHQAPTTTAGFWAFDVFFDPDGVGVLTKYDGSGDSEFEYPYDEWFSVLIFVDMDNDVARMTVADYYVDQWQFSTGVTNGGADFPLNQLNSINFYPIDANHLIYLDNVNFWQIPEAGDGQYCYKATPVDVGQHTVGGASCFGAGYHYGGTGSASGGLAAVWYSYTPSENGILSISSCNGDSDSRAWLFKGDCDELVLVGMNDDRCEQSNGDAYASYKEAYVEAGATYYIMWDDRWDNVGFKWDLGFSTDAPTEAAFCQSAQAVTAGEDLFVNAFVGEAAVAGDNIFDLCSSSGSCPAGYTGSNWYSWTPEGDGTATITSCDSGTDTYLYVYTGTCGDYNSLELIASSENDCGLSSLIEGLEVTAGTTYYFEWIDDRSADPFIWRIDFVSGVDETALEQGVKVFPNPANNLLNVNVDLPEAADNLAIRMVNTFGQVVVERYYGALQTGNLQIDVSNIPAGMYLVQVMDGNAQYTHSVIVE